MAVNNEHANRRVVPRWRSFREALETNELSSLSLINAPVIDGTPFLKDKESQWLENKELLAAVDLVSAATVLGESTIAKSAAEFILESGTAASPIIHQLARKFLRIENISQVADAQVISRFQIIQKLKVLKAKRLTQGRNAFIWADLARFYVLLGQIAPARQAMSVALTLAPTERFIVRSATRFFLHCKKPDYALHLLRKNPRTAIDPWLMAAEIAVSCVLEKTPKCVRIGNELLKDANHSDFHKSELASALGSLELFEGSHRKANKLFLSSLKQPTDNSLAQFLWASKRTGLDLVNLNLLLASHTSEARTFDADNRKDWNQVIIHAHAWANDEAFSARPRLFGSSIASSLIGDQALCEEIARNGLATNPGHPGLINNIAFALANQNKPDQAAEMMGKFDSKQLTGLESICLIATAGLIHFRSGNPEEGKRLYEKAIENAGRINEKYLKVLARLYLGRERVFQKDPDGLSEFTKAHEEAKEFKVTNLPDIAERISKQVIDFIIVSKKQSDIKHRGE